MDANGSNEKIRNYIRDYWYVPVIVLMIAIILFFLYLLHSSDEGYKLLEKEKTKQYNAQQAIINDANDTIKVRTARSRKHEAKALYWQNYSDSLIRIINKNKTARDGKIQSYNQTHIIIDDMDDTEIDEYFSTGKLIPKPKPNK